jgi:hypothetical protein
MNSDLLFESRANALLNGFLLRGVASFAVALDQFPSFTSEQYAKSDLRRTRWRDRERSFLADSERPLLVDELNTEPLERVSS